MSSRSEHIEGDRSDEEIIEELAARDDVLGEVFSALQESSTCSRKEDTNS